MTDTRQDIAPRARLTLFGYQPVPARVEAIHRPRSRRISRAILSLLGCWVLTPAVAIVPPHFPWALAAFGTGIYLAWTNWRGAFEIRSFEASCPSCGKPLTIKAGAKVGTAHKLTCYGCHHEPWLELQEPAET